MGGDLIPQTLVFYLIREYKFVLLKYRRARAFSVSFGDQRHGPTSEWQMRVVIHVGKLFEG